MKTLSSVLAIALYCTLGIVHAQTPKKDTLFGRAGQWKNSTTFVANNGSIYTRASRSSTKSIGGFDIQPSPDEPWNKRVQAVATEEQRLLTTLNDQLAHSGELRLWSKTIKAVSDSSLNDVQRMTTVDDQKSSTFGLGDQASSTRIQPAAGAGHASYVAGVKSYASQNCDQMRRTSELLKTLHSKTGYKQFVAQYPPAPQPPQEDPVDACSTCDTARQAQFVRDRAAYDSLFFNVYLKSLTDAIWCMLQTSSVVAHADEELVTDDISGDPCMKLVLDCSMNGEVRGLDDIIRAMNEITVKNLFREHMSHPAMVMTITQVALKLQWMQAQLGSFDTEELSKVLASYLHKSMESQIKEWRKRRADGDMRVIAAVPTMLKYMHEYILIGVANTAVGMKFDGSPMYTNESQFIDDLIKSVLSDINIDVDVKVANDDNNGYALTHVKGTGIMALVPDETQQHCLLLVPVMSESENFVRPIKGGITMSVVNAEVFTTSDEGNQRSTYASPKEYEITPLLDFDVCKQDDSKHYFVFTSLGPDASFVDETWTNIPQPVRGMANAPLMSAFKTQDYSTKKSETQTSADEHRMDLKKNMNTDMLELKQAAADLQAKKITYQQFMEIQKRISSKAMGNVEKVKQDAVYTKIPIDFSPATKFYVNETIDAKKLNPSNQSIVYGSLKISLSRHQ